MPDAKAAVADAADMDDDGDGTSVEAICRAFNAPINEEQAWALFYQTTRHLPARLPRSFTTKDLLIARDGSVRLRATGESV